MEKIFRVALIGPESSGKTTLCRQLAKHYKTLFVPEYAREFLTKSNGKYTQADLDTIALGQLKLEADALQRAKNILFCDTEQINFAIWSEYQFGFCSKQIQSAVEAQCYDLFLLTKPDIPWEQDPLRTTRHLRDELFARYERELIKRGLNYKQICGMGASRLAMAIHILEN